MIDKRLDDEDDEDGLSSVDTVGLLFLYIYCPTSRNWELTVVTNVFTGELLMSLKQRECTMPQLQHPINAHAEFYKQTKRNASLGIKPSRIEDCMPCASGDPVAAHTPHASTVSAGGGGAGGPSYLFREGPGSKVGVLFYTSLGIHGDPSSH